MREYGVAGVDCCSETGDDGLEVRRILSPFPKKGHLGLGSKRDTGLPRLAYHGDDPGA